MVLNVLFNPKKAERHPFEMFIIGFFYTSVSILISLWIFPGYSSMFMVFLTVISCLYVVQGAFRKEENREFDARSEKIILKEHFNTLKFILLLFLGFVVAFSLWALFLPQEQTDNLFNIQIEKVQEIRAFTGDASSWGKTFSAILNNNLKVLTISIIFALFYGAGAIFILVWNASVMGVVIGSVSKEALGIISLPVAFAKYFLHGIPEMFAYLVAALAGGILYISVFNGDLFKKGRTKRILTDVLLLVAISVILLILSALIEVHLSPLI